MTAERGDDDTCQRREERGQQDGDEHVGGLCCSHLSTIDEDGDGDERQSAGVEHEEHDHRVAGGVLLRVQLLQLFHSLQAHRGGGIVQAQHVGREVHEDGSCDGMPLRYLRKQTREDGTQPSSQHIDHSAALANLHNAQPECQHTGQAQRDLEGRLRLGEGSVHHSGKHFDVAQEYQLHQRNDEGHQEKRNPDIIQHHDFSLFNNEAQR